MRDEEASGGGGLQLQTESCRLLVLCSVDTGSGGRGGGLQRTRGSPSTRVRRITQYTCHVSHSHPTLEVSEVLQSWAGVRDLAGLLASPVTDPEVTPELTVEVEEFWWTSANKYYILSIKKTCIIDIRYIHRYILLYATKTIFYCRLRL